MIRFIRAIIYGAVAAIAATLLVDWLEGSKPSPRKTPKLKSVRHNGNSVDEVSDDAKKALLDELAAQT